MKQRFSQTLSPRYFLNCFISTNTAPGSLFCTFGNNKKSYFINMKNLIKYATVSVILMIFLASCNESRKRATDKLNELSEQAEEFNTQVDDGLRKIELLDSAVRSGAKQIKKYDSLVKESSSKIDSMAKEKAEAWEELTTY